MRARARASQLSVAAVVTGGAVALLPIPAVWVEQLYSRGFYLVLQNLLTPLFGMTSFAAFDLLLLAGPIAIVVWWRRTIRTRGERSRMRAALAAAWHTVGIVAALYLVFLVVWGLNYRREPLTAKLDYSATRITPETLAQLAGITIERLNGLYGSAHRGGWPALDELPVRLAGAFEQTQRRLGATRTAVTGYPKHTVLTPYFRRAGIDGMISPFSLEILVNDAVLPFERPYVVAHEWAHLAGFADESEASFVGWLTCLAGDDAARYSAWLALFPRAIRHVDEPERDRYWARLDAGPTEDLRRVAERVRQAVPVVQRSANRVYDQYLKANRVDAGIASYGEVVDLILGTGSWRQIGDGWR